MKQKIVYLLIFGCALCSCNNNENPEIKIMSFNIRYDNPDDDENCWNNRKEACIDMINDQKPDVFGIQEGLIHQVCYFDSCLQNYAWIGEGRDSLIKNNEYSAVFYDSTKFNLMKSGTFWLSETPEFASKGWDARYNRIATWVYLKDRNNEKEFLMMNTHFDHKGQIARYESSKLIVDKVKEITHNDSLTVFIMGDFNARPGDELFEPISAYFKSAQKEAPITDQFGTTNGYGSEPEGKIIDYIFYRNATPIHYQTIMKNYGVAYISDHYPITAVFEY